MADSGDKGVFAADSATVILERHKETQTIRLITKALAETYVIRPGRVLEVSYDAGRIVAKDRVARKAPPTQRELALLIDENIDDPWAAADEVLALFGVEYPK